MKPHPIARWRKKKQLSQRSFAELFGVPVGTIKCLEAGVYRTVQNRFTGLSRFFKIEVASVRACLLYTSPSPRDGLLSRMPSSA